MHMVQLFQILLALMLVLPFSGGASASGDDSAGVQAELVERLRAEAKALQVAEDDFRARRERGTLDASAQADYLLYLSRLRNRVVRRCAALERSATEPIPSDLPCAQLAAQPAAAVALDPAAARTEGERAAALDAELNSSLGVFDDLLLSEQEKVRAAAARAASASGSAAAEAGRHGTARDLGEEGQRDQGRGNGRAPSEGAKVGTAATGHAEAGPGQGSGAAGPAARGGQGSLGSGNRPGARGRPEDIRGASTDDVVARQLREAAESETNPQLREKLWEEYRRYKKGTR